MSYNARRNQNQNYGPPVSSVGQRRPQTNFISGGQLNRNQNQQGGRLYHQQQQSQQHHQQQQNKPQPLQVGKLPVKQPPPQQTKAPTPQAKVEPQSPAQQPPAQQQPSQKPTPQTAKPPQKTLSQPPPKTQPIPQPAQQPAQQSAQQPSPQPSPQPIPQPPPQQQPQTQSNMQKSAEQLIAQQMETVPSAPTIANEAQKEEINGENAGSGPKKPFWMKRTGRISKAEKMRKRNHRLRKMLQPKNALMVLNELVGSTAYNVSEVKCGFDDMFKATVTIEDTEHVGTGKSKVSAKTAAAETAIRAIVLKKLNTMSQSQASSTPMEEDSDVKMEEQESTEEAEQVSWSHIASFAIHKLFSSWDEDGNIPDIFTRSNSPGTANIDGSMQKSGSLNNLQTPEQKPAKKLPENALHMNPIMLLNQMHPTAKYEEISKVGNPPHIQFTVQCNVMDQSFCGVGPNKKAARKQAAFDACATILGLQYPPEILNEAPKKGTPMQTSESYTPY